MTHRLDRVGPEAFDGERLRSRAAAAVAFLADWCPFCRAFEPAFARLPASGGARLLVADVTADDSPLWDRFRLEVVPTVVVFHTGKAVYRADGVPGEGLGPADLKAIAEALRSASGPELTGGPPARRR